MASGAHCNVGGMWINASDARLKDNVVSTSYGLTKIKAMRPVDYRMVATQQQQVGFIAQEMEKIIPEVDTGNEGGIARGETLGLSYGNLIAVPTKGIQEQQELINEQGEKISAIQQHNQELVEELTNFQEELLRLKTTVKAVSTTEKSHR